MVIYCYTNRLNGHTYIGQSTNFKERLRRHSNGVDADHSAIDRAIQKYGIENFDIEIWETVDYLDGDLLKKGLNAMERLYIALLNPYYNITDGGDFNPKNNTIGYQWSDTTKPILADSENEISFKITSSKNSLALNYNDMKVFKDLEASTNVHANWENISESSYATQKSLILSSQSRYPDALYHAGFSNKELIQYGTSRHVLTAIDEYLEYMPNFKAILEKRPDIKAALESPDGHIYSLPRIEEMGLKAYPNILFINKAWLSKLIDDKVLSFSLKKEDLKDGLKLTRGQYKEVLSYFKSKDMNGDGSTKDEIPLSFVHGNWQGNESDLIASFGIAPTPPAAIRASMSL